LLSEKKALKRFLIIYIFSTLFLVAIGEFFYYKNSYNHIIHNEITILKVKLDNFLENNRRVFYTSIPHNLKLAIFRNKELINSNFTPKKIYFNKEYWIEDNEIYYRYKIKKRWWRIDFIIKKKINKEKIYTLYKELLFFNLFLILFLSFISIYLGKLFLKPMKETILDLENFIRDATHEMNTPISIILANIELLDEENKYLKRIKTASIRLSKMFEDLKYIKFHHTKKKNLKKINLDEFIEKRLLFFETQIENKNLKVIKHIEKYEIVFDEEDLNRVIDNLVSNAVKYAPVNSTIEIMLKNKEFCILNDGEIKNIENITNKFVRENKNEGGFGLGLYIVKELTKEYNIKLKITNINKKVKVCLDLV